MKTATFSCPHCSSPLRIRDRAFVEREVGCPECGERLEVTLDHDQEPIAHKIATEKPEPLQKPARTRTKKKRLSPSKTKPQSNPAATEEAPSRPRMMKALVTPARKPLFDVSETFPAVPSVLFSPVGIAWIVAGCVGLVLVVIAWPTGENAQAINSPNVADSDSDTKPEPLPQESEEIEEEIPSPVLPENAGNRDEGLLTERMTNLGKLIQDSVDRRGRYPMGTVSIGDQPAEDRFSWLAELLVQSAQKRLAEPQWDQPWNDPLNDRFVRQQREIFLNPGLSKRVGPDRYPASHFVGVAGVGEDAPLLPVDHSRAGIFGINRITRTKDIQDGLAETMMVAGATERLGSWAAGPSGIRAFTQEPYIEGPDGFGTGQADGMSVLMADGSVRFLNKNTDPAIIRQMAAMADQAATPKPVPPIPNPPPKSPLNEPPPQIVQTQPKPKTVIDQKPEDDESANPPAEELQKPEPAIPVDIPKALAVKLVKFEQIQAAPFEELLFQVEEMTGVPIERGDDVPEKTNPLWSQPVSLRLKETTVGQVLETLLAKANLSYSIETDHIELHRAK